MRHVRIALMTTASVTAFNSGYVPTPAQVKQARKAHDRRESMDPMMKRSNDSAAMLPYWDKIDAVLEGIDGMRLAGEDHLPKFTDESTDEYNFRLQMTKMTNVFSDIVEGLAAKPFEQHVTMLNDEEEIPESVATFLKDVDGSGNNLTVFAANSFYNGIANAIDWIFVDYSKRNDAVRNRADAKRAGLRPYWTRILARNVLDVRSKMINGIETVTYFKVLEPGDPDHIREWILGDDGTVRWKLYQRQETKPTDSDSHFVQIESDTITLGMIPVVPFVTGPRDGRNWKIKPPMKQAVDLQVELYQQESGLKFAKNLTAYPMLAANGISPPTNEKGELRYKIAVGPNRVLWSKTDAQGKVGNWQYLEPGSESLKFLASDIEATIRELRELGRQPLTAQSGNITVITAAVAASKAKSAVKQWALMLKDTLDNALKITMLWLNESQFEPNVHVFSEFDDFTEGEDLEALDNARERRDISRRTYWEEHKRRGVLSSNFSAEREEERLTQEALEAVPADEDEPDIDPEA